MKKVLFLTLCLTLAGCAVTSSELTTETTQPYMAKFEYAPAPQAAPGSSGVTFAITDTNYNANKEVMWITSAQFGSFDEALRRDLAALLVARGFSVRGPYQSYDLIPYSDKKAIDLILVPTVSLLTTVKDQKERPENMWSAPPVFIQTGNAEVTGKVTLELKEIATRELMWTKTIPLKKFDFSYSVRVNYKESQERAGKPLKVEPVFDGIAKEIEKQYPEFLTTISTLIDPEEMKIIKKQAQELKTKKGY